MQRAREDTRRPATTHPKGDVHRGRPASRGGKGAGEAPEDHPPMRTITAAASTAATVALLSIPATTAADPHTTCRSTTVKTNYTRLYYKTARVHGPRTPGRNIRRHGMTSGRKSRCRDLQRSNRTFRRWLAPPPTPVRIAAQATTITPADPGPSTTVASTAPAYSGGRYAIPAEIVQCESGG